MESGKERVKIAILKLLKEKGEFKRAEVFPLIIPKLTMSTFENYFPKVVKELGLKVSGARGTFLTYSAIDKEQEAKVRGAVFKILNSREHFREEDVFRMIKGRVDKDTFKICFSRLIDELGLVADKEMRYRLSETVKYEELIEYIEDEYERACERLEEVISKIKFSNHDILRIYRGVNLVKAIEGLSFSIGLDLELDQRLGSLALKDQSINAFGLRLKAGELQEGIDKTKIYNTLIKTKELFCNGMINEIDILVDDIYKKFMIRGIGR